MNENKWREIKGDIKEKFKVLSDETLEEDGAVIETIIFQAPHGKLRLEWTDKPKLLDVKTQYSRRAGTAGEVVKKVMSQNERVNYLKAYIEKDGEWVEMEAENLDF